MTEPTADLVAALTAVVAGEHAVVYGYGVVGARAGDRAEAARRADLAHRQRRNRVSALLGELGEPVPASAAAYDLPFPVPGPAAAARLAALLEERSAVLYADAITATVATDDTLRELLPAWLDASARAAWAWSGTVPDLPGLTESG